MKTIEQWANERNIDYMTIKIVKTKKNIWVEWEKDIDAFHALRKRKKADMDRLNDIWIKDKINGKEIYYYLQYTDLDGNIIYNFENLKTVLEEEIEERGDL